MKRRQLLHLFSAAVICLVFLMNCKYPGPSDPALERADNFETLILNNTGSHNHHPASEIWMTPAGWSSKRFVNISYSLPSIMSAFSNASLIPDFTADLCNKVTSTDNRVHILHQLHKLGGYSAGGYGPPLRESLSLSSFYSSEPEIDLLLKELSESPEDGGIGLKDPLRLKSDLSEFSPEFRSLFFSMLRCISDTYGIFKNLIPSQYLISETDDFWLNKDPLSTLMKIFFNRELVPEGHQALFNELDMQTLAFSSRLLLENISNILRGYEESVGSELYKGQCLEYSSSLGKIGIFSEQSDTISSEYLLIVNTGGNDLYTGNAANAEIYNLPVSIIIDLAGNDQYGSGITSNVCRSVFGMSLLMDLKGDDRYHSGPHSLVFSLGGFSFLEDREGNDLYTCEADYSLASSWFGYSILIDRTGNDKYSSRSYSQGFGGTGGVALLLDMKGNDEYYTGNGSFCQGAARGRWAEAGDGFNMGGGYGILIDNEGDDKYKSGSFSQAASYYYGFGILNDRKGNDKFNVLSHSQGSATHKTIACFIDNNGDDLYNASSDKDSVCQIIGYGRDRSHAFFLDEKGNDEYVFGNKSYGVGDINATGVAMDLSGDDSYNWINNNIYSGFDSFGSAQAQGDNMSVERDFFEYLPDAIGLAYDRGGNDSFSLLSSNNEKEKFFSDNKKKSVVLDGLYSIRNDHRK